MARADAQSVTSLASSAPCVESSHRKSRTSVPRVGGLSSSLVVFSGEEASEFCGILSKAKRAIGAGGTVSLVSLGIARALLLLLAGSIEKSMIEYNTRSCILNT